MHPSSVVVSSQVLSDFDYRPLTRVVFGAGTVSQLGTLAKDYGANRVLLVTDHGLEQAGHSDRGREVLEAAGLTVAVFDLSLIHISEPTRPY